VSTWTALSLMARYAIAALAEVARAKFLQARDWAVAKAGGRKAQRDVHPGEMPVYFRRDRGDS